MSSWGNDTVLAPPASVEQSVLESYLLEMDVTEFHAESSEDGNLTYLKRSAELPSQPRAKTKRLSWERLIEGVARLRSELQALLSYKAFLEETRSRSEDENFWRDAAESEKQQCRLKNKLKHCMRAYSSLKATLDAAEAAMNSSCVSHTLEAGGRSGCGHHKIAAPAIFNLLSSRLKGRLEEVDAIYREAGAGVLDPDVDEVQVHRGIDAAHTASLEFKRSYLLPFDASVTSNTVWKVLKLGTMSNEQCSRVYISSEEIMAAQGCFVQELDCGGSVVLRSRYLMKRIELPEGSITLLEGTTEWFARPVCSREWSYVTRDWGWLAVCPVPSEGVCQVQRTLRLQAHECAEPTSRSCDAPSLLLTRMVSDVMVPSFRKVLNLHHQLVDNALVDASRRRDVVG